MSKIRHRILPKSRMQLAKHKGSGPWDQPDPGSEASEKPPGLRVEPENLSMHPETD